MTSETLMKTKLLLFIVLAASFAAPGPSARAQSFDFGSDGSMGALNVTSDTTLNLPPDGIFRFTTISVNAGATLRFNRNAMNTPVYLLATGDILINGTIDVSGSDGQFASPFNGGAGGPGGFDGGVRGADGHGPGAGRTGADGGAGLVGGAAYGTPGPIATTNNGSVYGSPILVPLVGGSGGGGSVSVGGGGGGGAILIASNTRIRFLSPGEIKSIGRRGGGSGSGGAIRLLAPDVSGNGLLGAFGSDASGGDGRLRIDTIDRAGIAFNSYNSVPISIGAFMTVFPPGNPRLDIVQAAGTTIPEGTNSPVTITLPVGSDPNRTVTVQARNLGTVVPIEVVLTPDEGLSVTVQTQIDNLTANPATVTVPVTFPVNTPVAVNAWRR